MPPDPNEAFTTKEIVIELRKDIRELGRKIEDYQKAFSQLNELVQVHIQKQLPMDALFQDLVPLGVQSKGAMIINRFDEETSEAGVKRKASQAKHAKLSRVHMTVLTAGGLLAMVAWFQSTFDIHLGKLLTGHGP